jgi:diguanylate cyclase (GGDEF)-like protein
MARERSAMVHKQAARVDYLTGIANRRAFLESANSLISRCRIDDVPLSLAVFDLDRFKAINDSFGHKAGDDMLVVFTETARKMLRPTDMLGRLGGEEFAVVMPAADMNSAYIVAERIRAAFAQASRGDGDRTIAATTSAGVATAWPGQTLDGLMTAADGALYRAKALGRDRVEADESRRPPSKRAEPVMSARVA